ncbi:hypothetical protein [Pedobacter nyackensis]|uniref:hypothetical protein n=1 Tax=Pedobacter nyackensis TaxID=475255 RepID=UPI0029307683|nr:hypothetical protein [Pedobacter nyackensis]
MHAERQIKLIADTLLPGFIPKDPSENELTFHFTIPPNKSYKVNYKKSIKNEWIFISFEPVES